jgi:nitroreductase
VYANEPDSLARGRALLKESNARWAVRAPLLVFVFARKRDRHTEKPLRTSAFDTGAAWFSLALQASQLGLVTRAMGGIHHEQVHAAFDVPESEFVSIAAIAVGYPGCPDELPSDLAEREVPSQRKPQHEFVFAGRYRP